MGIKEDFPKLCRVVATDEAIKRLWIAPRDQKRIGTVVGYSRDLNSVRLHWDGHSPKTCETWHGDFVKRVRNRVARTDVEKINAQALATRERTKAENWVKLGEANGILRAIDALVGVQKNSEIDFTGAIATLRALFPKDVSVRECKTIADGL